VFFLKYRTAIRLRSACLAMLYRKVIRLNSLGEKSIGEVSVLIIYITNSLEVEPKGSISDNKAYVKHTLLILRHFCPLPISVTYSERSIFMLSFSFLLSSKWLLSKRIPLQNCFIFL
jgi:hypothetical protein